MVTTKGLTRKTKVLLIVLAAVIILAIYNVTNRPTEQKLVTGLYDHCITLGAISEKECKNLAEELVTQNKEVK